MECAPHTQETFANQSCTRNVLKVARAHRTTQAALAVMLTTPVTQSRKTDPDVYSRVNTPSPWATAEEVGSPRRRSYCSCHRQSASTHPDEAPNMDRGPRESKNAATETLERTSPSSTCVYVHTNMRSVRVFVCDSIKTSPLSLSVVHAAMTTHTWLRINFMYIKVDSMPWGAMQQEQVSILTIV